MEKFAKKKSIYFVDEKRSNNQKREIINNIESGKGLESLEEKKCQNCKLIPSKTSSIKDIQEGKGLKPLNERQG